MNYHITIQNQTNNHYVPKQKLVQQWAETALKPHTTYAEITIRIVDTAESQHLNHTYRGKNAPTNVLAFPHDKLPNIPKQPLGDLVICASLLATEAQEQAKTLDAHWAHIIIHGVLHLLGYDHVNATEAATMEQLEIDLLRQLGYPNPYQEEL